ncbi:MAG: anthranilate synthase component I [Candidatus Omnitrophica bacterium]|nr:anthranilate synthase component I [Candidatus Omnitrophota bacterium]
MNIYPTESEFLRLARRGNVIPVYGELFADLETPVSAFLKLDDGRFSYLLESVEGTEKVARFSFLGSRPRWLVTATGRHMEVSEFSRGGAPRVRRFETREDPLREVERLMRGFRFVPVPGLPRFCGGLVGYLGYNVVRFLERLPAHQLDDLRVPDLMLMLTDTMAIFDHAQHTLRLVANAQTRGVMPRAAYRHAIQAIEAMAERLRVEPPRPTRRATARRPACAAPGSIFGGAAGRRAGRGQVRSAISQGEFEAMVAKAKGYIRAGDVIQVVLSQRLERDLTCGPLDVYRALRSLNPSPYMFLLRFGGLSLVGASPEMLVRCEEGRLETRPIAGTRPRGATEREDERLIQQLRTSPKERAEHLMLVDLGRNDLGRVAQVGSVRTPELMVVEKYSHVLHLVSGVTARLRPGRTAADVLRATFPAGTVTGAPKVRAMELIAELERYDRGPYAGAVGYLSFSGNLDTCITIRTILIKDGRAYIQAGAGIVADSQPAREYQETLNKAKAMLQAIAIAERRFAR